MLSNSQENIKLEEEAISEILVADTDSESGAEGNNVENDFEEEEEEQQQQQQEQQASAEAEPQSATSGRLPTRDHLKEGTQIFILLSIQQKVWIKVRLHTSTKTAHHYLCWCCLS